MTLNGRPLDDRKDAKMTLNGGAPQAKIPPMPSIGRPWKLGPSYLSHIAVADISIFKHEKLVLIFDKILNRKLDYFGKKNLII